MVKAIHNKKNSNSRLHHHHNIIDLYDKKIKEFKENVKKLENLHTCSLEYIEMKEKYDDIENDYLLSVSRIVSEYIETNEKEKRLLESDPNSEGILELYKKRNELNNNYMVIMDPNFIPKEIENKKQNVMICNNCTIYLENDSSCFDVCTHCGVCTSSLVQDDNKPSYKELQTYNFQPVFTYNKSSHLLDWIRRFQSKENRSIEQSVLDKVILEAKKNRITDLNDLTEDMVKKFLKKLKLNDYYDNVINIINRLNGRDPFRLTSDVEEKIISMFLRIQEPFERHKPPSRKNFLSYSYTLRQLFMILNMPEFAKYFPLLKSIDKLRLQDEIFKKIVNEMTETDKTTKWVFYPSV